jgi:hypothetical protein
MGLECLSLFAVRKKLTCGSVTNRCKGFHHLQELSFSYYDTTPWADDARMIRRIRQFGRFTGLGVVSLVWGVTMDDRYYFYQCSCGIGDCAGAAYGRPLLL